MEEKAFQPSKRRLDDARKQGKVLKSPLLSQSLVLLLVLGASLSQLPNVWLRMRLLLEYSWGFSTLDLGAIYWLWYNFLVRLVLVVLGICSVIGLLSESLQVGVRFGALKLDFARLDPAAGIKRSLEGLREVPWLLLRLVALSLALYWLLKGLFGRWLIGVSLRLQLETWKAGGLRAIFILAGIVLAFALLDYGIKRRRFYKEHSMSREEVLREIKDDEGDPMIRAHRKAIHESLMMRDIVRRVRQSKVVIVERAS